MAGVDFRGLRPKMSGQDGRPGGGGEATDCAGVGFAAIRAGGVLPVKAAAGGKTVAGAYFRGRRACTQYDPKVILGAKTLTLKLMHIIAPRSHTLYTLK